MRRDQTRAPEPMRSTLPNTDQPRIPHSEYYYTARRSSAYGTRIAVVTGSYSVFSWVHSLLHSNHWCRGIATFYFESTAKNHSKHWNHLFLCIWDPLKRCFILGQRQKRHHQFELRSLKRKATRHSAWNCRKYHKKKAYNFFRLQRKDAIKLFSHFRRNKPAHVVGPAAKKGAGGETECATSLTSTSVCGALKPIFSGKSCNTAQHFTT